LTGHFVGDTICELSEFYFELIASFIHRIPTPPEFFGGDVNNYTVRHAFPERERHALCLRVSVSGVFVMDIIAQIVRGSLVV
jgi:hypothetical protein